MEIETRYITPPRLDEEYLGAEILCHRPMREGSARMAIEEVDEKIVAHNYGHGGSGLTLAPGAAKYVIQLLRKEGIDKTKPVAIIGAGILGLFSALELVHAGCENITIYAKDFENLASHKAGGLFAKTSLSDLASEEFDDVEGLKQSLIETIGIDSYKFYKAVAMGAHPEISHGATILSAYFPDRQTSGLEPYVGEVMDKAKDVILNFGTKKTQRMVAYDDAIFIDTGLLMEQLTTLLKNHVAFVQKTINKINELSEDVVINCTGLGAASLVNDNSMVSVQGHLITLKNQNPADLQCILSHFDQDEQRHFYIIPKILPGASENDIGVIGGTFINGATEENPHREEFKNIVRMARKFYGL